jgi:hypothetical protein
MNPNRKPVGPEREQGAQERCEEDDKDRHHVHVLVVIRLLFLPIALNISCIARQKQHTNAGCVSIGKDLIVGKEFEEEMLLVQTLEPTTDADPFRILAPIRKSPQSSHR